MSVINFKEDFVKTNILMEEGDSSLEPGEVKTPPHGIETIKQKMSDERINIKTHKSEYPSHTKSASKQETDKCAEKVRAILELDAIRMKEEMERKKEQKSETLLHKAKDKKKDHKKSKSSKGESKKKKHGTKKSEKDNDDIKKKSKSKKRKQEEHNSQSSCTPKDLYEKRRSLSSAGPPQDYTTPINIHQNLSHGITGYNKARPYRSFNPFMRNYHTDFRNRGKDFTPYNRARFNRPRSYFAPGSFQPSTVGEETKHSPPPHSRDISPSQLLWTRTKPSISFAYNLLHLETSIQERKISEHSSEKHSIEKNNSGKHSSEKKKKHKKLKERELKKRSSSKISHKSSKRKKIRQIRETLQSQKKPQTSPSPESEKLSGDNIEMNTPARETNTPEITKQSSEKANNPTESLKKVIKVEKDLVPLEVEKVKSKVDDKDGHIYASLTPPKQKSPSAADSKSSNIHITNKLQEIQCRVDKLLEDDELGFEAIQAAREKLLQRSIYNAQNAASNKIKSFEKYRRSVEDDNIFKTSRIKEKPDKKTNKKQCLNEDREFTPPISVHSKTPQTVTVSTVTVKKETNFTPPRETSKADIKFVRIKTEKMTPPLEDSPSNQQVSSMCTSNASPDTDDYSDNWENDEEMDINTAFQKTDKSSKCIRGARITSSSSPSNHDSDESESTSKIQSTTPTTSPPSQKCLSPKINHTHQKSPEMKSIETSEMQQLYNQFIKSVESANLKLAEEFNGKSKSADKTSKEHQNEHLSTASTSNTSSSSSSATSDTSGSSSGSSSSTSSSDSASEDSNDTDALKNKELKKTVTNGVFTEGSSEKSMDLSDMHDNSSPNVAKDLKKLENLEANLLRIQMMRANYDAADEISDELLKMEKLFLIEKNIILNKFKDSSAPNKAIEGEKEADNSLETSEEALKSRGQFVQSLQKMPDEEEQAQATNIFNIKREVIKLTISPVKLPKTSAIFEADNDVDNTRQPTGTSANNNATVKQTKPVKEVAIVKPIMESKDSSSNHHQRRRRSPLPSQHTTSIQSRSRSRRGRVRSLSVSPPRTSSSGGRCTTPPRRTGGGNGFFKQWRNRNFDRRTSRSRSPSGNRQRHRSGDLSPMGRKRRQPFTTDDRFRKHSPKRNSRSRSRSLSRSRSRSSFSPPSRHHFDRYSRSPLPFKPPSPPTDPNASPHNSSRNSLSPDRHIRSNSRSPKRRAPLDGDIRTTDDNIRHRSLSPKHHGFYKQHSPPMQSNTSYYFNHSPNRISLDARINIVLNGPASNHTENANNAITGYEDYSHYGQYGPATYMPLPSDPNGFYANQYVPMANAGGVQIQQTHTSQQAFSNLSMTGNDESNLYMTMQQHANTNATNYYYNRFGTHPFGLNQPSSLLKELPKASAVAVQKGNVLEIVPCTDIIAGTMIEQKQNESVTKTDSSNEQVVDDSNTSNSDKGNRSILKLLDGDPNTVRIAAPVKPPKKKKVNFEDGVYPNHNSDEEDRKVIESKIRVKMRRLRKKLGITPQCNSLLKDKIRKNKQKDSTDKKAPPPPPAGSAPSNVEQPIYLLTHTPTPLLYFHFDGVVHSMYVSQMETPIPPRLLNPKCVAATSNMNAAVSHHSDSQSPLYMQSPINAAGVPHLHNNNSNKKDPIAAFTRPIRNENLSPKIISTPALHQATGSPKLNFKLYSPIDNTISNPAEIGNVILSSTSPNNLKNNNVTHTLSSTTTITNHFLPKRQESPKDAIITRTNTSMGLLPLPVTHPSLQTNTGGMTPQARIPVIGVLPTVIPKVVPPPSEQFISGFAATTMQTSYHPINSPNPNYLMASSMTNTNSHHTPNTGVPPYYNTPNQRTHRHFPNYMVQQSQSSPSAGNLSMCHLVDNTDTTNIDMDKFASPQGITIPYNYKGP